MITLTWNPRYSTLAGFRHLCKNNRGAQVDCNDTTAHYIEQVTRIFEFSPSGKAEPPRKAFVLKLRTSFEWGYPVVKSFLISVSEDGSLCNIDQLAAYIRLSYADVVNEEPQGLFANALKSFTRALLPKRVEKARIYAHG